MPMPAGHQLRKEWADCGYIDGPARQDEFYWHVLPTFVGSAKTTVVIVSDALRYEVARDVAALLERERGGNVRVSSMQAVFPSITEVGMPALLPHQALELAADGSLVLADGMPTATTPQREAVLTHVEPTARALRSSAYLNMAGTERKALLKDSKLVYLYHNKIDATGEKAATQDDVFDACADTVEELSALARRVCTDAPGARVVITADHGFIYTRRELSECQMLGKPDLPSLTLPSCTASVIWWYPTRPWPSFRKRHAGCLLMLAWDVWVPVLRICPARERALQASRRH